MARRVFYITCHGINVTTAIDNARLQGNTDKFIRSRRALLRRHPNFAAAFTAYVKDVSRRVECRRDPIIGLRILQSDTAVPENDLATRTKDHLPSVLLTLLSIVQALALELMWAHLGEHDYLYAWSYAALLSWIQIGATLLGVLLIWLIYSNLVMRFRWVPTTSDSIFPFLIGIIQFSLIASLGPERLGAWFLLLGLIFGAMAWVSQLTLRRARLDGDNYAYFSTVTPATQRDFYPVAGIVSALASTGIYLWASGDQGWFALIALIGAISALAFQMHLSDVFWRRSLMQATP